MEDAKYKIGFAGIEGTLEIKDDWVTFREVYSFTPSFRVNMNDVEAVSVEKSSKIRGTLVLIGRGTTLGSQLLYYDTAVKCQNWIMDKLEKK